MHVKAAHVKMEELVMLILKIHLAATVKKVSEETCVSIVSSAIIINYNYGIFYFKK